MADWLQARGMSYCVVEQNAGTVERCAKLHICIVHGDASDENALREAGIERAALFVCTIPNDAAMFTAVEKCKRLNPKLRIIVRCRYVSSGFEAMRRGAHEIVVEEQVVAHAFESLLMSHQAPPAAQ